MEETCEYETRARKEITCKARIRYLGIVDVIALNEGRSGGNKDSRTKALSDDVVHDRRQRLVDIDRWDDRRKTAPAPAAAMLNGESIENGLSWLTGLKRDCRAEIPAVDDGFCCAAGGDDGDGFAVEVDVFEVGAGGYEDGVAEVGSVDAGLDGGLVSGDVDDGGA